MYFPIGWPKVLHLGELRYSPYVKQVKCNRDRILVAIITYDTVSLWFCKPCVPIVMHRRNEQSVQKHGTNVLIEWKPDSSMLVIATSDGHLIFYQINVISNQKGLYMQTDSPHANFRRDSAELFIKEIIPPLHLTLNDEVSVWDGKITSIVCITLTELMVATSNGHILRYNWDGKQNRDYSLDLRRVPFCINQQVSKAEPIVEENTYVIAIDYSPLVGGFAIVLNDGRGAFLTATSLKFDPNQTQGIWAQGIEDIVSTSVNHKYRLISFGRSNSECIVYYVDETTGALAISHQCSLSSKDYPGCPGPVNLVSWTPDGCAMAIAWQRGGIALWSTFGALLMCSLGWDYGLHVDLERNNPLVISCMEWGTEGYQLWMIRNSNCQRIAENEKPDKPEDNNVTTNLVQLDFVKSTLTINPCMGHQSYLYLQGEDRLYINSADTLVKKNCERTVRDENIFLENVMPASSCSTLSEGRQWLVLPIPSTYTATNWPIRYSAIDPSGQHIAIAGRTGLAMYTHASRRWKLFGNETQEKDFIVSGGLLWWRDYTVLGCYSSPDNSDELRFYARECKLDNKHAKRIAFTSAVLLMNVLHDQLITFGADGLVCIWNMEQIDTVGNVEVSKIQIIDISALCVHPACIVSLTLTSLKTEIGRGQNSNLESIVLNVSGRLLMVQRENKNSDRSACLVPTVLASCVENVWVPSKRRVDKVHLTEALWLFCGAHGMRVWLPLFPRDGDKSHSFMSKRIMLPFHLRIYPLAILFEEAIILGAENDTMLYTNDSASQFSLPFSILQRTSQVYLHQILRQLIRRNLGYHAWEIARSCTNLPYFPHSLELLLHEVLEEEATSKEPIPDAQLPSVIDFIMEFSVYLQTVVQCARKTEIALWPYLFSAAGKPKDLFQECLVKKQLDTAASYLIILQNLETSAISRQFATLLLDTALEQSKWELAKDLVRFLRAIDPSDVESPRNSMTLPNKLVPPTSPPVSPNADDISLILGNVQRARSYSTTVMPKVTDVIGKIASGSTHVSGGGNAPLATIVKESAATNSVSIMNTVAAETPAILRKKSAPIALSKPSEHASDNTAEEFFIDVILQRHARRLLTSRRLSDLGYFAAHLDFHLVAWLGNERQRVSRVDDFVAALKHLHEEFDWPYPQTNQNLYQLNSDLLTKDIHSKLRELHIDSIGNKNNTTTSSQIGDSGYMSFPGVPCGTGLMTSHNNTMETGSQLTDPDSKVVSNNMRNNPTDYDDFHHYRTALDRTDHTNRNGLLSGNFRLSETHIGTHPQNETQDDNMSVTSSILWGAGVGVGRRCTDEYATMTEAGRVNVGIGERGADNHHHVSVDSNGICSSQWEMPSAQLLEHLASVGNKGSHRSEVQLRYLLQIFMEASCLEWSILISVLLRDALAVVRTVNAAKSADQTIESVSRLHQGLQILLYWTNNECLGYRAFMLAIENQLSVLSSILSSKIQNQQIVHHQQAVSATLSKLGGSVVTSNVNAQSIQCTVGSSSVTVADNPNNTTGNSKHSLRKISANVTEVTAPEIYQSPLGGDASTVHVSAAATVNERSSSLSGGTSNVSHGRRTQSESANQGLLNTDAALDALEDVSLVSESSGCTVS